MISQIQASMVSAAVSKSHADAQSQAPATVIDCPPGSNLPVALVAVPVKVAKVTPPLKRTSPEVGLLTTAPSTLWSIRSTFWSAEPLNVIVPVPLVQVKVPAPVRSSTTLPVIVQLTAAAASLIVTFPPAPASMSIVRAVPTEMLGAFVAASRVRVRVPVVAFSSSNPPLKT